MNYLLRGVVPVSSGHWARGKMPSGQIARSLQGSIATDNHSEGPCRESNYGFRLEVGVPGEKPAFTRRTPQPHAERLYLIICKFRADLQVSPIIATFPQIKPITPTFSHQSLQLCSLLIS